VHLVTEELDSGDVLAQGEVQILAGDTEALLEARVLEVEHQLYPKALSEFVAR
jgi:folate-dependent phosphoribosylglycinamide formyltransferase PurN